MSRAPGRSSWRAFDASGAPVVATILAAAVFAPWLAPYGQSQFVGGVWDLPSATHWLGTDNLGRDMVTRLIFGARNTVSIAVLATALAFVLGVVLGISAAALGGWLDVVVSRCVEILLSVPVLISALMVLSVLGNSQPVLIATIGLLESTRVYQIARAAARSIDVREFVAVARLRGEGLSWIILREILPNAAPALVAEAGLRFSFIFLFIASLSFLGLGIQPPAADWGSMVRENAAAINFGLYAPLYPACAIALLTVAVNRLVDRHASRGSRSRGRRTRTPMPSPAAAPSLNEPPPAASVLCIEGLCVRTASGAPIVEDITLELKRGEVLGLIGESGAGKSTVGLAALGHSRGLSRITAGRIEVGGTDPRPSEASGRSRVRGIRIAYVAQSAAAAFNPAKRLIDQVCEGPVHHGIMSRAVAEQRAIANFRALGLPEPETFGDRFPHQVSGGQLQRAMTAMAMSCGPDVLVLDEPTTALDVTTQIDVLLHIKKLIATAGTAALYISHDLALVAQIADRILVLRDGRMVETGPTHELLATPRTPYARALVAERGGAAQPAVPPGSTACMLEARNLTVNYRGNEAVRAANLTVGRAQTVAVIGESGSGKTSLAYAVCGLVAARVGSVSLGNAELAPYYSRRSRDQLRRIQLVFQLPDVALNPRHRVGLLVGRPATFYFGIRGPALAARVTELLTMVGLDPALANRHPDELSGGQTQRVCIARALAARPDVLVCDEVTAALDPLIAADILQLLRRLQEEIGLACLFITHDLGTVRRVAHRVVVMLRGQIVAEGSTTEVFGPGAHHYVAQLCGAEPEMRIGWLEEALERRETVVQSGFAS